MKSDHEVRKYVVEFETEFNAWWLLIEVQLDHVVVFVPKFFKPINLEISQGLILRISPKNTRD